MVLSRRFLLELSFRTPQLRAGIALGETSTTMDGSISLWLTLPLMAGAGITSTAITATEPSRRRRHHRSQRNSRTALAAGQLGVITIGTGFSTCLQRITSGKMFCIGMRETPITGWL